MLKKINEKHLFYFLLFTHLLYLWTIPVFLTQDGPSHLYNSKLLLGFNDPECSIYRDYYTLNFNLFPNWTANIILSGLLLVFKPMIAEKLFLSLVFMALPLTFRFALKQIHPNSAFLSLFAFIFTNSYFLIYGFYNFQLSIILFFLFIGVFQIYKQERSFSNCLLLSIILAITFFTHPVALIVLIVYSGLDWIFSIAFIKAANKSQNPGKLLLQSAFIVFPALALFGKYLLNQAPSNTALYDFKFDAHYIKLLLSVGHLSVFSSNEKYVFLFFSFLFFLITCLCVLSAERAQLENSAGPLIMTIVFCLFVYFFASDQLAGGAYLSTRILIFIYLLILLLAAHLLANFRYKKFFVISAFIGSFCLLLIRLPLQLEISRKMEQYIPMGKQIPDNSTLLPLGFSNYGEHVLVGESPALPLFRHISGYIASGKNIVSFDNYEANTSYFPLLWRPELNPYKHISKGKEDGIEINPPSVDLLSYKGSIDFVILYGNPLPYKDSASFKDLCIQLNREFTLVNSSPDGLARLYKNKN